MLGSQALELGPLNIPIWLVAAIGGFGIALLVQRTWLRKYRDVTVVSNDFLSTALIVMLVVWKLTPVVTRFAEISAAPARLLYYPGGAAGMIAGAVLGMGVAALGLARRRRRVEDPPPVPRVVVAAAITLAVVLLPVGIVSVIPSGSAARTTASGLADTAAVVEVPAAGDSLEAIVKSAEGRPTVLVFWATWCGPCTAQMPEVDRFHASFGEDVQVIAVNLTASEAGPDAVRQYIDENGFDLPVMMDTGNSLGLALDVRATPTTIILDSAGNEQFRRTGAVTSAWIERRVLPLL